MVGLIVLIAVVLVLVIGGDDDDAQAEAGDDSESENGDDADNDEPAVDEGADSSPDGAVEAYLTALSEGDAESALSLVEAPSDTTHMTQEVLEASLQIAPISEISVSEIGEVGEFSVSEEVTASFTVGEEEVTHRFRVTTDDDGESWALDAAVTITEPSAGSLDVTVNGEEFATSDAYVFFGAAYELDLAQDNFTFGEDSVIYATDSYLSTSGLEVTLTDEATDTWRQLILDAIDECVSSNEREVGCGLDLPEEVSGDEVVEGTVERSLPSSTQQELDALSPQPDWSNPNLVGAESFTGQVDVEYECRFQGETGICELLTGDARLIDFPVVDMAAEELEVVWE